MKINIAKYFWDLNDNALNEAQKIIRNPLHPKFNERIVTFLSRCDKPRELFYLISKKTFVNAWPGIKKYWAKVSNAPDFRDWWQTVYEEIARESQEKKVRPPGAVSASLSKIGDTIRGARIKRELNQKQLAFITGIKQPDISKIEEGKKNITFITLVKLCKALDIKVIDIV